MSKRQKFIVRRAGSALLIAFLAISFSFVLFRALPGDAVSNFSRVPNASPEMVDALRHQLGIDKPLLVQYGLYLKNLADGNLGLSFRDQQPVLGTLLRAVRNSLPLLMLGTLIAIFVGTLVGVTAGYGQGTARDRLMTGLAMLLYSMPVQWLALLLVVGLSRWFPSSGVSDPFMLDTGFWPVAADRLHHIALPAVCVALMVFGPFALVARSSQLEALGEDHVLTARAKGYHNRRVVWREAFRSAMLPIITLSTLTLGFAIGGQVLVESVFSWPGVGLATLRAVGARDYPMLQGIFLFITLSVVAFNFLGDVLHSVLDPRVAE
jgi:ABC-type dipeptide/oligopeptide/nickel transport system permease component